MAETDASLFVVHRRYPWGQWIDGSPHKITKGEDFDCSPRSMRATLSRRAYDEGFKVRITGGYGGDSLTFQYYDEHDGRAHEWPGYGKRGGGPGRPAKYPWDEWTDGNVHIVSEADMSLTSLKSAILRHKDTRGLNVRTFPGFTDAEGNNLLYFQFAGELDPERMKERREQAMRNYHRKQARKAS